MAFSAATPIEASRAACEASAASVVQSVLAFVHQKAFFWVTALARSPRIARARAELDMSGGLQFEIFVLFSIQTTAPVDQSADQNESERPANDL